MKPRVPEDDEQADLFTGSDGEMTGGEASGEAPSQPGYTSYQEAPPVVEQPGAAKPAAAQPVFAMPPPPPPPS